MKNDGEREERIKYEALTEFSQVSSIASEWDTLLERSRCNWAFSCSKWFLATPEFLPSVTPLVLIARRGDDLAGVMPLVVDSESGTAGFPIRWTGYHDIIAEEGDADVIVGLLKFAIAGSGGYNKLSLRRVKPDSNCVSAARILDPGRYDEELFVRATSLVCSYVDLSCGYDEYMRRRSKNFRHNLNRIRNKARREGIVAREIKPGDAGSEQVSEAFLTLHLSRFGGQTVLGTAQSILRKLIPALFIEGRIRVFALLKETRIMGVHLALAGKDGWIGWSGGFLPEVSSLSPGNLLLEEAIRQACISGMAEYDFGWGLEEYKTKWTTHSREIGELEFTVRGQVTAAGN